MSILDNDLIEQERIAYAAGNIQLAEMLYELHQLQIRIDYLEHLLDVEEVEYE